ncbi:hypothetical protein [Xanthobacter variabilis]|uniref:hypothetical protein n=1 Tax=Xanthobacter variabilis TaxID=3119932 RepID=UPI00374E44EB
MMFDPARYPDGTKKRRHTNNKGRRQIRTDEVFTQVQKMAERLGIPYAPRQQPDGGVDARLRKEQ